MTVRGLLAINIALLFATPSLAQNQVVDEQTNLDIQILQAWNTPEHFYPSHFELERCQVLKMSSQPPHEYFEVDCTEYLQEKLEAPLAHRVTFSYAKNRETGYISSSWDCYLTEIRPIIKDTALEAESFAHVGFYHFRGATNLVAKSALRKVGHVNLKGSKEGATVFRFVSLSRCWRGTMSSSMYQTEQFKPFVDYKNADGNILRRWDLVEKNYVLGQAWGYSREGYVEGFNRELDLLEQ